MLLGAALYPYAVVAGQVIVGVFAAITVLVGGLLTGQWIAADLDSGDVHPGYFLPTVAGAFVAAATVAQVGFRSAAWAAFGIGVICWLLLGSLLLNRLFFRAQFLGLHLPLRGHRQLRSRLAEPEAPGRLPGLRGDCPRAHHWLYRDRRGPVADPARPEAVPAASAQACQGGLTRAYA
jgi:hypothetical protein